MGYTPQLEQTLPGFFASPIDFKHRIARSDDAGRNEEMHIHDSCEIYVNVSGNGTFMVENRFYPVTRGDVILTRPNEMHHGVFRGDAPHEHYCIWFPAGENSEWLTRFWDREAGEGNLLALPAPEKEKLLRLLSALERETTGGDLRRGTALFLQILLLIEDANAESGECVDLPYPLSAILDEIGANYREPLRMARIAARYFISQSTLNRLFQTHLHTTPHIYLENLRLARAKQMLAAGCDVTATALECGFADCSHFILLFRRRFGITPGKYRKNYVPQ
ncbi:MAG: AraC family transcriptional regulator [Clostridia bacterium]|nr:AraC family transcriptional regulator [Clostridia bacterium]